MAFELTESQELTHKIRINLSAPAWDVIRHDADVFGGGCRIGSFINDVLENYITQAQASVGRMLRQEESELRACLKGVSGSSEIREKLIQRKKTQLLNQLRTYKDENECATCRLRNEVIDMLTSGECEEDQFYEGKISAYVKAVLEEYARLPYGNRERIYYAKWVHDTERAMEKEVALEVQTASGTLHAVVPYAVVNDSMNTANYLVGLSQPYTDFNAGVAGWRPACLRISRLKNIRQTAAQGSLSDKQKKELQSMLKTRGVPFLAYREKRIVVRLTPRGQEMFGRLLHLRPDCIEIKDDIYTFNCTLNQAEFYFIRFGQHAEILEPAELRQRFAEEYKAAHGMYLEDVPN